MQPKSLMAFLLTSIALVMSSYFAFVEFSGLTMALDKCKNYSAEFDIELDDTDLKVGEGKLVKGLLKNTGNVDDFQIIKEGPDWVVMRPEKTRLDVNQTEEIFVYISPDLESKGKYNIKIITKSSCLYLENKLLVNVLEFS